MLNLPQGIIETEEHEPPLPAGVQWVFEEGAAQRVGFRTPAPATDGAPPTTGALSLSV